MKPQWDSECVCEENPSFWQTKGFLGVVTILAALLLAFPYYSDAFFPHQDKQVVYLQEDQVQTITLDIEGMTCTGCEATVEQAAVGVEGVLEAEASYESGQATVKYDQGKTTREAIVAAINKTGFTVNQKLKD